MTTPPPPSGLTPDEQAVMDHLVAAWQGFIALSHAQPPRADIADFARSIHEAQRILGQRVLARDYPGYWRAKEQL